MKKTVIVILLCFARLNFAAEATPDFESWEGKDRTIGVHPTQDGRVSIRLTQYPKEGTLLKRLSHILKMENADWGEFIFPVSACHFAKSVILDCSTENLSPADFAKVEMALSNAGSDQIRIKGSEISNDALSIEISNSLVTTEGFNGDDLGTGQSMSLSAHVWLYVNKDQSGWASIKDLSFPLNQ